MRYLDFMVPRLEGDGIEEDFDRYLSLVKKGVAGVIVFGGELEALREGIGRLQAASKTPLIIASDLERGLGQQVKGGTLFPPAMALANLNPRLLKKVFSVVAGEAAYVGINTIFAPVLDINTNPKNPIISTRAFGEEPKIVSRLGTMMIKSLGGGGIVACGKHFPGHGDTSVDSHIGLPVLDKPMDELRKRELVPFNRAIGAGVKMIMLGHLRVPALEPEYVPVTISKKAIAFLKKEMGFKGIITTDALNMGGLGSYSEAEAVRRALNAGVDMLLHPSDAFALARQLQKSGLVLNARRLLSFRRTLRPLPVRRPPFDDEFAFEVTKKTIKSEGKKIKLKNPLVVVLDDDNKNGKIQPFVREFKRKFPMVRFVTRRAAGGVDRLPKKGDIVVAVFSSIRAWKGGASPWLIRNIEALGPRASALISFGSPYLIRDVSGPGLKVYAYQDSEDAQRAVVEVLNQNR